MFNDFDDAQPGDEVVLLPGRMAISRLAKIERVLKLHVVVDGIKFRKAGGSQVGGSVWSHAAIRKPTSELRASMARERKGARAKYLVRVLSKKSAGLLAKALPELEQAWSAVQRAKGE